MIAPLLSALALCVPAWHAVPGAPAPANARLSSVAAASPTDVWAVGGNLSEHWDGSSWTRVPLPAGDGLRDVAAVAGDAWGAGVSPDGPLVEHWSNGAWGAVSLPTALTTPTGVGDGGSRRFYAVSASGPNDVWVVGSDTAKQITATNVYARPVVLHWDGAQWAAAPAPRPADTEFADVVAVSPSDVWAAGGEYVVHWDGTAWHSFHLRRPSGTYPLALSSIDRRSDANVLVAGSMGAEGGFMGENWGAFYRWNGTAWRRSIPDGGGSFASYDAAAAGWIADNSVDPEEQQAGTQLFTVARPRVRTALPRGHVIESLAFDGSSLWGVGWIGSGLAHPNVDYEYKTFRPLIMRFGCR